jgi:hypothetical protein
MTNVGILHQMWAVPSISDRQCISDADEDVRLAEALGYESFWFGEHHFNREKAFFGRLPVPELLIARLSANTRRIRLGTGVKEVVQAFVTASLAGWKAYVEDPKPTLDAIKNVNRDYNIELGAQSAAIEKPLVLGTANDPKAIGTITEQRFKDMHDQLRSVAALKADLDYKAAFDASFITAAQAAAA